MCGAYLRFRSQRPTLSRGAWGPLLCSVLTEAFLSESPDWVFFIDCDAFFTDMKTSLGDILVTWALVEAAKLRRIFFEIILLGDASFGNKVLGLGKKYDDNYVCQTHTYIYIYVYCN